MFRRTISGPTNTEKRVTESRKILLSESGILGLGIRNLTQEIRNPLIIGIRFPVTLNPDSKFPESKTVLDYLTWNDTSFNCVSLGEKAS